MLYFLRDVVEVSYNSFNLLISFFSDFKHFRVVFCNFFYLMFLIVLVLLHRKFHFVSSLLISNLSWYTYTFMFKISCLKFSTTKLFLLLIFIFRQWTVCTSILLHLYSHILQFNFDASFQQLTVHSPLIQFLSFTRIFLVTTIQLIEF